MIGTAHPWLPETALAGPASVAPVAQALDGWSAEWLAHGRLTVPFAWRRQAPPAFGAQHRFSDGDGAAGFHLAAHPRAEILLAGVLLDRPLEAQPPRTAADTTLLREVVQAARDDLSGRIAACLTPFAGGGGEGTRTLYELPITLDEGSEIFTLAVPAATLIAAARARAGAARKRPALSGREDALLDQSFGLAAVIGRNRFALADLERLGCGDVLPLDTPTGEWLDLRIGTARRVPKAASIALAGTSFEIRIERPTQEW